MNYNQYIQNKIKHKLNMKAIIYVCFKLEEKAIRSVKWNKNNFANVMKILYEACINYLHLCIQVTKKVTEYQMTLNPLHGTGLFLCSMNTSGNLWFSDIFQGV